jgi:acyl-CoA synthetase (AMP-forming)/AMP-acid ligase II
LATGVKIIPVEPEHADSIVLADVGFTVDSCNLRICNSEDEELEEGHVGHIQIKGRNVTRGYYNDPMATNGLFTTDGWLRTGDVGFMLNKRLIVSGRWKNMVVLNGQNYYPHDFEQVVTATGLADAGKIVACGYWDAVRQSEDVILFVLFRGARPAFAKLAEDIRRTIFLRMGVCVNRIVPVKQIPKTTSGKTRHYLLVEKYIKGDYGEADEFLSVLNFKNPGAESDLSLAGISSLAVMQLAGRIRNLTGADVPAAAIFRCRSLSELYVLMTAGNGQTTFDPRSVGDRTNLDCTAS